MAEKKEGSPFSLSNLFRSRDEALNRVNRNTEEVSDILSGLNQAVESNTRAIRRATQENDNMPVFMQNVLRETEEQPVTTSKVEQIKPLDTQKEQEKTDPKAEAKPVVRALTKEKVRGLDAKLNERVFGQGEAISTICSFLKNAAVNMKLNPKKPDGCYLFAGPSGVGKTELAKALADSLDMKILIINMGEYGLEQDVTKLIGTAKGYVGYNEGGLLTNFVKENPVSIIVLDELEKAHSSIDKILLSIMAEGICTDNKGVDVSFKNTIIISTSNLGAEVEYYADMSKEEKHELRMQYIKEGLRPEIINRYDDTIQFDSLSKDIYQMVVNKFLTKLDATMVENNGLNLKYTEKLSQFIAEKSYDPAMGGRPASRFIEKIVLQPLVDFMLTPEFDEAIKEIKEIMLDLNKAGNICFKGKKGKILGTLPNTAELVARVESNKFTKKPGM